MVIVTQDNLDERNTQLQADRGVADKREFFDGEQDQDAGTM
jgi:hypothetical protein